MDDDPKRQPRKPEDSFAGALDDLFGPQEPDREPAPEPVPPPDQTPAPAASRPQPSRPPVTHDPQARPSPPPPSYPVPGPAAPSPPRSRPAARLFAIGCAASAGIALACFVALVIIGLLVGDDTSATSPQQAVETQAPSIAGSPTPTPVVVEALPGSNVPLHAFAPVSSTWHVAVSGTIPDATRDVLERNEFNSEPDEGKQYFIASILVRNVGRDEDVFPATLLLRAYGDSGHEYSTFEDFCGVIPDAYKHEPIAPGETAAGNVCWSVSVDDAANLTMLSVEFPGGFEAQHFSLGN